MPIYKSLVKKIAKDSLGLVLIFFDYIAIAFLKNRRKDQEQFDLGVVRMDNIGDFALWISSFEKLRVSNSVLIAGDNIADFAKDLRLFKNVISIDRRRFCFDIFYRYNVISKIQSVRVKTLFNPTHSRVFFIDDAIVRAANSDNKIGCCCSFENSPERRLTRSNQWYSEIIDIDDSIRNEYERNMVGLETLKRFVQVLEDSCQQTPLPLGNIRGNSVVVMMRASDPKRCWPVDSFHQVIDSILSKDTSSVYLCGSLDDRPQSAIIMERFGKSKNLVDLCGRTTLIELLNLIKSSRFVLSNETSAIHMAALADVESICIAGGGHYGKFVPYSQKFDAGCKPVVVASDKYSDCFGCNWNCIYESDIYPCIKAVRVESVIGEIKKIMD